jgi:hypothetical protein
MAELRRFGSRSERSALQNAAMVRRRNLATSLASIDRHQVVLGSFFLVRTANIL